MPQKWTVYYIYKSSFFGHKFGRYAEHNRSAQNEDRSAHNEDRSEQTVYVLHKDKTCAPKNDSIVYI